MAGPTPEQVERFRSDLEALTGEAPSPARRLGVAVSGGPDSMALLLLAAASYPGAVSAATVNHGLRVEAAAEAVAVADACRQLNVPHRTLAVDLSPFRHPGESRDPGSQAAPPLALDPGVRRDDGSTVTSATSNNLQDRAREARYAALTAWAATNNLPWIAVAHQRDDLAETFLMRARRGAGVGGLAAMRATRPLAPDIQLIRPLLGWARCELGQIAGNACAADPSNTDPRFDRARMRALIAATPDLLAQRLAFSARNLRDAEDALAWAAEREWRARATGTETIALDPDGLPYEILRRLTHRAVTSVRAAHRLHAPFREQGLDRLIATLQSGGIGTIAGVKADTKAGIWRFTLAPARRSQQRSLGRSL